MGLTAARTPKGEAHSLLLLQCGHLVLIDRHVKASGHPLFLGFHISSLRRSRRPRPPSKLAFIAGIRRPATRRAAGFCRNER